MEYMTGDRPAFVITDYEFPSISTEREISGVGGELSTLHCKTEQDAVRTAKDADVLLARWAPITLAVIQELPRWKMVDLYGIGIDNVDLEAACSQGIAAYNMPDCCIDAVADRTFALTLTLSRQLPAIDQQIRQKINE